MRTPTPISTRVFLAAVLAGGGSVQAAQDEAAKPTDLLRGPTVEETAPPGVTEAFGEAMQREPGMAAQRVPMRVFVRGLAPLRDDPALAPTEAQRDAIRAAMRDYRDAVRAARPDRPERDDRASRRQPDRSGEASNGEGDGTGKANRRSRAAGDEPRRRGDRPAMSAEDLAGAMQDVRARLPDPAPFQRRVWEVLTDEQRRAAEAALATALEEHERTRRERAAQMSRNSGEAATIVERARELTPEQRRERIERARERRRLENRE